MKFLMIRKIINNAIRFWFQTVGLEEEVMYKEKYMKLAEENMKLMKVKR